MCWYCYWGLPKRVAEIYQRALNDLDGDSSPLEFGPGHIVWSDFNLDSAEWCLEHFDEHRGDNSDADLEIVRRSLKELAAIPLEERCPEPGDTDDWSVDYAQRPPGSDVVMLREEAAGKWVQTWPVREGLDIKRQID